MFVLLRHLQRVRREAALPKRDGARSLAIRHVDAGSCNACEHELAATAAPHYDLQRFGLDIVASPRHADVLLVTGPVTTRMAGALRMAYEAMPEPRLVAALGDCALGCGVLGQTRRAGGAPGGGASGRHPNSRLPTDPAGDRRRDPRRHDPSPIQCTIMVVMSTHRGETRNCPYSPTLRCTAGLVGLIQGRFEV